MTFYLQFVMELKTRRVHFAGCTPQPSTDWMCRIPKNLTDSEDGFLNCKQYLLMDRDDKFSAAFRSIVEQSGIKPVRLPPRSPNLNAHIERFMRSIGDECLNRLIFFGEASLRNAVTEYLAHYHGARNHQGLDNQEIEDTQHSLKLCRCHEMPRPFFATYPCFQRKLCVFNFLRGIPASVHDRTTVNSDLASKSVLDRIRSLLSTSGVIYCASSISSTG